MRLLRVVEYVSLVWLIVWAVIVNVDTFMFWAKGSGIGFLESQHDLKVALIFGPFVIIYALCVFLKRPSSR